MSNIATLILTKDRPMQFDCCLRSLVKNFPWASEVFVLIHNETPEYTSIFHGYDDFEAYNSGQIPKLIIVPEKNGFKESLVNTLKQIAEEYEHILLLTDDTICYRELTNITSLSSLLHDPSVFTVSLRLGENTTNQNPDDASDKMSIPVPFVDGVAIWNWRKEKPLKNTGYPISMDGHIYRSEQIADMTERIPFKNLREWEGELVAATQGDIFKEVYWNYSMMACPQYSYCVNVNTNMVQYPFNIRCGPYSQTAGSLLDKFKAGFRVNLEKTLEGVNFNGSHVNLPLRTEKVV
jgi:hypothetical protein